MKNQCRSLTAIISIIFSICSQASTTWLPINNDGITIIIPYLPTDIFTAPANAKLSLNGSTFIFTWSDTQHASRYQIQAKNSQGIWDNLFITQDTFALIDSRFTGYSEVKVMACSYNSCNNTGNWSLAIKLKRISFIHTEMLGSPVSNTE